MRQLTLKDLCKFYAPCRSCGTPNRVTWITNVTDRSSALPSGEYSTTLTGKSLEIILKITYYNKFSLMIDVVSHAILSSDAAQLNQYILENEFRLVIKCHKCKSMVVTKNLKLDLSKRILKPILIEREFWIMTDEEYMYTISSLVDLEETVIVATKLSNYNNSTIFVPQVPPWSVTVPALMMNKFATKQDFLERIQTLMVFS